MVAESEKDYSEYIQILSHTGSILALLSGFTFTAFTILLTLLPNPSSIASQFTLVFLAALFYLFMTLLTWGSPTMMRHSKNIPPLSKGMSTFNSLVFLGYVGLESVMVLMPFVWNLIYVALAIGVLLAVFIILTNIYIWKPLGEYRKSIK
jgi:hypothetical protein